MLVCFPFFPATLFMASRCNNNRFTGWCFIPSKGYIQVCQRGCGWAQFWRWWNHCSHWVWWSRRSGKGKQFLVQFCFFFEILDPFGWRWPRHVIELRELALLSIFPRNSLEMSLICIRYGWGYASKELRRTVCKSSITCPRWPQVLQIKSIHKSKFSS